MKKLLFLSLLSLSLNSLAAEWKTIAETTNCPEKVKILAKAGEKYVKAVMNGKEDKLFPQDRSSFLPDAPRAITFHSEVENKKLGDVTFTFIQPSVTEANTPKLDIIYSGIKRHCNMRSL